MVGRAVALAVFLAGSRHAPQGAFDLEAMGHVEMGWISRWLKSRSERRATKTAQRRLEDISLHLRVDAEMVDEIEVPRRRKPIIDLSTQAEKFARPQRAIALAAK